MLKGTLNYREGERERRRRRKMGRRREEEKGGWREKNRIQNHPKFLHFGRAHSEGRLLEASLPSWGRAVQLQQPPQGKAQLGAVKAGHGT